ncbi:MAG TPA: lysophospholipid acyltransferase family protein [Steroidobacteraceae bacterium]|nr:lysophospholipid acyltransferase family protein [Steroidobacteraceae bacterium]
MAAPDSDEAQRLGYHTKSGRELTWFRRILYQLLVWIAYSIVELLWRSGRIRVIGEQHWKSEALAQGIAIPVCWHQHLLICARYSVSKRVPLKSGFLVSPSLDGEAPTWLAEMYGATVIRGSSTHTGSRAVRQLYKAIRKDKLSPLITPDGPRGPRFVFKPGALFVAQLAEVPVVPLAFAAKPAKVFRTWDRFVLPSPFARIVIAVGEPVIIARELTAEQVDAMQETMSQKMLETYKMARSELDKR